MPAIAQKSITVNAAPWVFYPMVQDGGNASFSCTGQGAVPALNPVIKLSSLGKNGAGTYRNRGTVIVPDITLTALQVAEGVQPAFVTVTIECKFAETVTSAQRLQARQILSGMIADTDWGEKVLFGPEQLY
jgi:hypothetical protein